MMVGRAMWVLRGLVIEKDGKIIYKSLLLMVLFPPLMCTWVPFALNCIYIYEWKYVPSLIVSLWYCNKT